MQKWQRTEAAGEVQKIHHHLVKTARETQQAQFRQRVLSGKAGLKTLTEIRRAVEYALRQDYGKRIDAASLLSEPIPSDGAIASRLSAIDKATSEARDAVMFTAKTPDEIVAILEDLRNA